MNYKNVIIELLEASEGVINATDEYSQEDAIKHLQKVYNQHYEYWVGLEKRQTILKGLKSLTIAQCRLFVRAYGHYCSNPEATYDELVQLIPAEKLDNIISQIIRTIEINREKAKKEYENETEA